MKKKKRLNALCLVALWIFLFAMLLGWAREENRKLPLQRFMENVNADAYEVEDISVVAPVPTVKIEVNEPAYKQKEPPADFGDAVYEGTRYAGAL